MRPTRFPAARVALVAALLGPLAALAPAAHADASEDAFLGALKAKGINYPNPAAAIIAGHEVCNELDLGRTPAQVANDVMTNSPLDGYHAGYLVGASMRAFCPRYAS